MASECKSWWKLLQHLHVCLTSGLGQEQEAPSLRPEHWQRVLAQADVSLAWRGICEVQKAMKR